MAYKLIQEFKEIVGNDPIFVVRGAISPLLMLVTWQEEGHPLHLFCITKGRDTVLSLNEKEYIAIATDKFRNYFEGKISIQELQNEYDIWEKDAEAFYNKITDTDLDTLTDEELRVNINKVNELFLDLARITLYIENVDLDKILGVTGEEYRERIESIWERATEAVFISFEYRRLKKLIDIITSKSGDRIRKAKFIFTDYFWTKSPHEISTNLDEINAHPEEKTAEYEKVRIEVEHKKAEHAEWLKTIEDDGSKRVAEFAQLVMNMRDQRKDPLAQMQAILVEISEIMLERAGINKAMAPFVMLYEYIKGISYLSSIKQNIEERDKGCIYIAHPDVTYETENCDFEEAIREFEEKVEHKLAETDTLKGQIACKGKVQGIVRVILDPHDDKGFQEGDILVTSMTRPEFVPIMKKAGAVVTNEGGITCHAAIVSRELNIPCIIGTKVATKVLKDGDVIEVDAEKGIVTVINATNA